MYLNGIDQGIDQPCHRLLGPAIRHANSKFGENTSYQRTYWKIKFNFKIKF